jgi:hypothetical protein
MKQEGDFVETISTCNKSRKSTWANGSSRNCTAGMRMVVTVSGKGSKRKSVTSFEPAK